MFPRNSFHFTPVNYRDIRIVFFLFQGETLLNVSFYIQFNGNFCAIKYQLFLFLKKFLSKAILSSYKPKSRKDKNGYTIERDRDWLSK